MMYDKILLPTDNRSQAKQYFWCQIFMKTCESIPTGSITGIGIVWHSHFDSRFSVATIIALASNHRRVKR